MESININIVENDYKAMLGAVQRRPERIRLLMKLSGGWKQVFVVRATLMENRDVLMKKLTEMTLNLVTIK